MRREAREPAQRLGAPRPTLVGGRAQRGPAGALSAPLGLAGYSSRAWGRALRCGSVVGLGRGVRSPVVSALQADYCSLTDRLTDTGTAFQPRRDVLICHVCLGRTDVKSRAARSGKTRSPASRNAAMNWGAVFANGSTPETARRSELSTESTFSAENANDEDRCSAHNLESKPFCCIYSVIKYSEIHALRTIASRAQA